MSETGAVRRSMLAALLALASSPGTSADFTSAAKGTTVGGFLKLGAGARAAGMGEAYSAVADEASALYWNPAGMTRIQSKSAVFMHAAYVASSYFDYASFAQNLGRYGAWGIGTQFFSAGSIPQTDASGATVGNFTPNDLAVSAGYAYRLQDFQFFDDIDDFAFGIGFKYIQSRILATAKTAAVDFGLLSRPYFDERFRFAATVSNIGSGMTYETQSARLPLAFRLGTSCRIFDAWLASADLVAPNDNNVYPAVGTEYRFPVGPAVRLSGRAGYDFRSLGDIDGLAGPSLGLGLQLGKLGFDYGFSPLGAVGQAHRASISLTF